MKEYRINDVSPEKVTQAEKAIKKNGGTIYVGDSFDIMGVEGNYKLKDGNLFVQITVKPFLASWNLVEDKLREFFKN